jgi:hypothetical protein
MCASARINQLKLKPSDFVWVWMASLRMAAYVWAGFATKERLPWWKRQGQLVDLPASHFAERNDVTRELIWDEVPPGLVIRGLVTTEKPVLKVVTRASTPEEFARYGHHRMPVLEPPLFSAELPSEPPPRKTSPGLIQGELF